MIQLTYLVLKQSNPIEKNRPKPAHRRVLMRIGSDSLIELMEKSDQAYNNSPKGYCRLGVIPEPIL